MPLGRVFRGKPCGLAKPVADTTVMTSMYSQSNLLGNALVGSEFNHRVLSQNIANVNTPGYKTQRLDSEAFQALIDSANARRGLVTDFEVETPEGLPERVDGNNVDIEHEVSELKKNALAAQAYSHLLASKLATLRRAMTG